MTPLERKFQEGGGSNRKNHPWGGYGYFLEPHIDTKVCAKLGGIVIDE